MHKFFLTLLSVSLFYYSNAQTEIDALRYSKSDIVGTARFSAMAGAYGALGADFTTLSYNPAGIGFYQFSELTFTPSFGNMIATSYFGSGRNEDEKYHTNFSNFGYVVSSPKSGNEWKRLNLAFGYNRTADYKKRIFISGENSNTSMIDNFVANANGNTIDNLNSFTELLAWNTYLFDPVNITNENDEYKSNLNSLSGKRQEKVINSSGSSGEYVFSVGTSYEDRIYLGATIGMPSIDYYEKSTYTESEFADTAAHLQSFDYTEELSTTGKGFNLKVGVIARLNDWVRLGGALHSPTFYDMEDEYSTAITAVWSDSLGTKYDSSPFGYFNYELKTPWKAIGSLAINIKKKGLITADIEMMDYASAKLNSDTYKFTDENDVINSTYTKATNIRLGAEMKYKPFRFRAGYALYGSPYKDNAEIERKSYTFGLGVDKGHFIVDFAYVFSEGSDEHFMYSSDLVDAANIITTSHNFLFTLGLRY
ncbi:MAG TPA: hypothetical protein EYQ06_07510 [Flavobacteriales bacterium]|nr:hypothetical protein [Flavobacteriales bacterium]HIK63046.1 hypothetical protein [Flavobacteriales bacterium]